MAEKPEVQEEVLTPEQALGQAILDGTAPPGLLEQIAKAIKPCPVCGEPRGDASPCPHCGMA